MGLASYLKRQGLIVLKYTVVGLRQETDNLHSSAEGLLLISQNFGHRMISLYQFTKPITSIRPYSRFFLSCSMVSLILSWFPPKSPCLIILGNFYLTWLHVVTKHIKFGSTQTHCSRKNCWACHTAINCGPIFDSYQSILSEQCYWALGLYNAWAFSEWLSKCQWNLIKP